MPKQEDRLTPLELQIMQIIWKRETGTVAEVQQDLPQDLAYTTVQTMLNILQRKGKLRRKLQGRAFVYRAAVSEDKATTHAVRDLIDRMFGGSTEDLVMSLIRDKQIDGKKLAKLTRQFEKQEDKQ